MLTLIVASDTLGVQRTAVRKSFHLEKRMYPTKEMVDSTHIRLNALVKWLEGAGALPFTIYIVAGIECHISETDFIRNFPEWQEYKDGNVPSSETGKALCYFRAYLDLDGNKYAKHESREDAAFSVFMLKADE
jgi:hypothetical protein